MTMVRGRILYAAGKWPTIDLNAVVKELAEHAMPTVFLDGEAVREQGTGRGEQG